MRRKQKNGENKTNGTEGSVYQKQDADVLYYYARADRFAVLRMFFCAILEKPKRNRSRNSDPGKHQRGKRKTAFPGSDRSNQRRSCSGADRERNQRRRINSPLIFTEKETIPHRLFFFSNQNVQTIRTFFATSP